jgi:small subunit ribosomal protein S5
MEALGVHNVLTKSLGSSNPHNVVRAVFDALGQLESAEQFAHRLGRPVDEILPNYTVQAVTGA